MEDIMHKLLLSLFTQMLIIGFGVANTAKADITNSSNTSAKIKIDTIVKMYEQDIDNEGMDYPVVLQQYASPELQAAMQLEQDYFDKEQMSCHIGYDVLWNSQDPDYAQDKQFAVTDDGLVKVSLAQGGDIYYKLACKDTRCQVADVILDDKSFKEYLLKVCR